MKYHGVLPKSWDFLKVRNQSSEAGFCQKPLNGKVYGICHKHFNSYFYTCYRDFLHFQDLVKSLLTSHL